MREWRAPADLARGQYGVVHVRQAEELGIPVRTVNARVQRSEWSRPKRRVPALPGAPTTYERDVSAALLAAGGRALAARWTAAYLWELTDRRAPPVQTGSPTIGGWPSRACRAPCATSRRSPRGPSCASSSRSPPSAAVVVCRTSAGAVPPSAASPAADVYGRVIATLDIAYPEQAVGVEVDGFRYHSTPAQKDRDDNRENALQSAGWIILRISARRLRTDEDGFVRQLRSALAWEHPGRIRPKRSQGERSRP